LRDPHDLSGPAHQACSRETDASLGRAVALVRFLRERCPWDARQDPQSLRPYLLEEAHEVAEAISSGDDSALAAELGDLLLNVAFQIALAEERGSFNAGDVVERLEEKMEARHPHVYGDAEGPPDWEAMKAHERTSGPGDNDPFEGVPPELEPLSRAMRVQERMAALGFDWPDVSGPLEKVREETSELEAAIEDRAHDATAERGLERVEEEIGDLLFAVVGSSGSPLPWRSSTSSGTRPSAPISEAGRLARDGEPLEP
jgi:MazG family protein